MLIYGNTPGDIVRKIQSKLNGKGRMKKIILSPLENIYTPLVLYLKCLMIENL